MHFLAWLAWAFHTPILLTSSHSQIAHARIIHRGLETDANCQPVWPRIRDAFNETKYLAKTAYDETEKTNSTVYPLLFRKEDKVAVRSILRRVIIALNGYGTRIIFSCTSQQKCEDKRIAAYFSHRPPTIYLCVDSLNKPNASIRVPPGNNSVASLAVYGSPYFGLADTILHEMIHAAGKINGTDIYDYSYDLWDCFKIATGRFAIENGTLVDPTRNVNSYVFLGHIVANNWIPEPRSLEDLFRNPKPWDRYLFGKPKTISTQTSGTSPAEASETIDHGELRKLQGARNLTDPDSLQLFRPMETTGVNLTQGGIPLIVYNVNPANLSEVSIRPSETLDQYENTTAVSFLPQSEDVIDEP